MSTVSYNINNKMISKSYLVIFALLVTTIFCVMTSSTTVNIQAQSPPNPDSGNGGGGGDSDKKETKEVSSSSKSSDDNVKSDSEVKIVSEPTTKNKDPVKPLTDGPTAISKDKIVISSNPPIVSPKVTKDDCKNATKEVQDTLCKLLDGGKKGDKSKSNSNNGTGVIPNPTPFPFPNGKLPKNCSSQFDKNTNNTLIICDKTIVKVIKGPTHTVTKTQTLQPINKNYYYSYPQTQTQLNYGSSLSANLAMYGVNAPATYLLLLDSKQLCLIAGDTQCVALQDKFMTSSITTIYDSSAKEWTITGTVKDVSQDKLSDIQVTALFYDGKGNTVGDNAIAAKVSPSKLDSFEDGVFSFKANVKDDLNGKNPVFIVLNYSNDKNSLKNDNQVGPIIGSHTTTHGVPY